MVRRAKSFAWDYYYLNTGHDAMVPLPNELASLLQRYLSRNNTGYGLFRRRQITKSNIDLSVRVF